MHNYGSFTRSLVSHVQKKKEEEEEKEKAVDENELHDITEGAEATEVGGDGDGDTAGSNEDDADGQAYGDVEGDANGSKKIKRVQV